MRTADGREGWVHRAQLERTLTPGGAEVRVAGPAPEARTAHHWEVGLATGDFGGANVVTVNGAYALTSNLLLRADVSHLLGDYSNGWLGTAGIAHVLMPALARVALRRRRRRRAPHRAEGHAGPGRGPHRQAAPTRPRLRGFLTNRFLLQAEYRSYVIFTSRDENEEIDEWTVGFTYFF